MEANQVVTASLTWSASFAAKKVMPRGNVHRSGNDGTKTSIVKP